VPLKRIFAAAPERLQLLGPRLAPFKVQRTINYPIDLEELWLAIAQVTSGPNDETDGTIERVVLDERGIPSTGSMPRVPIPPRPPAPLAATPPPPPPVAAAATSASGRYATARVAQPAPEPPLRAPPPPRAPPPAVARAPAPPRTTSDTGRMRAPVMPPMTANPPPAPQPQEPLWTAETPSEDDFAEVAAQARYGVQQKAVDEAARRKRQRVFAACGIAVAVAGAIVFLIEKFYDPDARVREQAIAAEVKRMSDQQKVTDDLTLIEIDIENAIMNNDLDKARAELAQLIEKSPEHPRREFLEKSIDRAAELARLSPGGPDGGNEKGTQAPVQAAVMPSNDRPSRSRTAEKRRRAPPSAPPARTPIAPWRTSARNRAAQQRQRAQFRRAHQRLDARSGDSAGRADQRTAHLHGAPLRQLVRRTHRGSQRLRPRSRFRRTRAELPGPRDQCRGPGPSEQRRFRRRAHAQRRAGRRAEAAGATRRGAREDRQARHAARTLGRLAQDHGFVVLSYNIQTNARSATSRYWNPSPPACSTIRRARRYAAGSTSHARKTAWPWPRPARRAWSSTARRLTSPGARLLEQPLFRAPPRQNDYSWICGRYRSRITGVSLNSTS
jgi:hypothetical protein